MAKVGYRKGLRREGLVNEKSYVIRVTLKKAEKKFYLAVADAQGLRDADGKPSLAKALAYLARVALNCYAEHTTRYQEAYTGSLAKLLEAGLSFSKGPNQPLKRIRSITKNTAGRRQVEIDDDV